MKNKKNLNALQQASKSSLMEGKEIEKNLESLEVYLDVIKDGKRPEISPTQIQKQDTMEPKNEQESKEDEDGDVMIS